MKTSHLMFGAAAAAIGLYFVTRKKGEGPEIVAGRDSSGRLIPDEPAIATRDVYAPIMPMYAYGVRDLRLTPYGQSTFSKAAMRVGALTRIKVDKYGVDNSSPTGRWVDPPGCIPGHFCFPIAAPPLEPNCFIRVFNPTDPWDVGKRPLDSAILGAVADGYVVLMARMRLDMLQGYNFTDVAGVVAEAHLASVFFFGLDAVRPDRLDEYLKLPYNAETRRNVMVIVAAPKGV